MGDSAMQISAIDLFCGAGGLSLGLQQAGIHVAAGIDLDPACKHPYEANIGTPFIQQDVASLQGGDLEKLWESDHLKLLAGCAPCQPFSSHRRGMDTSHDAKWSLLSHFQRLIEETNPHFVTMENVTRIRHSAVNVDFIALLEKMGYSVTQGSLYGPRFGLPQERRRLVLLASRIGPIQLPQGISRADSPKTVDETIGELPFLKNGEQDRRDRLHQARALTPININRIRASVPGGTWRDWPEELQLDCHKKASGKSFQAFYGRMRGDQPAPTITTQAYNLGTGRFGHPSQDRTISLREAAMLQGFPRDYSFVPPETRVTLRVVGRLIGNAVPPPFGMAIGGEFVRVAEQSNKDVCARSALARQGAQA